MAHHQRRLALVVVAVSLFHSPMQAGVFCLPPSVEKNSPYHYLVSLADALSYAKLGLDRTSPATLGSEPRAFDMMVALKLGKADLECAKSQVAPFAASPNDEIKTSAEGAVLVFSRLLDLDEASVAAIRAFLDSVAEGRRKPGSVFEGLAELAALYDETWKALLPVVGAAVGAVVEVEPTTRRASGLALTKVQRDEILQKLQSTFGDDVKRGMRAGQLALTGVAAALYEGLGDPRWKLRDSK